MRNTVVSISAIFACLLSLMPVSCTNESYDTGDGGLSYLCADFVEARTTSDTIITEVVTDDGAALSISRPLRPSWASVPDTLYRALFYYNKNGNPVEPLAMSRVPVIIPRIQKDSLLTDPVGVESVWMSASGKYVNISLLIKTGIPDSVDARQWISVVYSPPAPRRGVLQTDTNPHTPHRGAGGPYGEADTLLLLHSQNCVPEYYTSRMYVSIPTAALPPHDVVNIRVNTYGGMRTYTVRQKPGEE